LKKKMLIVIQRPNRMPICKTSLTHPIFKMYQTSYPRSLPDILPDP
jgi:hypothetical protein